MAADESGGRTGRWTPAFLACAGILCLLGMLALVWAVLAGAGPKPSASSRIGGPFRLESSAGGTFDSSALAGRPYLLTFGFTRCPSTCPTTLAEITNLIDALQKEGRSIDAYFVTVDPERDTAATLRDYLTSFSDRIVGLTGSPAEIAEVARLYRATVRKVPSGPEDYTFEHTTSVYLMDAQGRFVVPLDLDTAFERGEAEVRRVLKQSGAQEPASALKTP